MLARTVRHGVLTGAYFRGLQYTVRRRNLSTAILPIKSVVAHNDVGVMSLVRGDMQRSIIPLSADSDLAQLNRQRGQGLLSGLVSSLAFLFSQSNETFLTLLSYMRPLLNRLYRSDLSYRLSMAAERQVISLCDKGEYGRARQVLDGYGVLVASSHLHARLSFKALSMQFRIMVELADGDHKKAHGLVHDYVEFLKKFDVFTNIDMAKAESMHAYIHFKLGNIDEAVRYQAKALKLCGSEDDPPINVVSNGNLLFYYQKNGAPESEQQKAKDGISKVMNEYSEEISADMVMAFRPNGF